MFEFGNGKTLFRDHLVRDPHACWLQFKAYPGDVAVAAERQSKLDAQVATDFISFCNAQPVGKNHSGSVNIAGVQMNGAFHFWSTQSATYKNRRDLFGQGSGVFEKRMLAAGASRIKRCSVSGMQSVTPDYMIQALGMKSLTRYEQTWAYWPWPEGTDLARYRGANFDFFGVSDPEASSVFVLREGAEGLTMDLLIPVGPGEDHRTVAEILSDLAARNPEGWSVPEGLGEELERVGRTKTLQYMRYHDEQRAAAEAEAAEVRAIVKAASQHKTSVWTMVGNDLSERNASAQDRLAQQRAFDTGVKEKLSGSGNSNGSDGIHLESCSRGTIEPPAQYRGVIAPISWDCDYNPRAQAEATMRERIAYQEARDTRRRDEEAARAKAKAEADALNRQTRTLCANTDPGLCTTSK